MKNLGIKIPFIHIFSIITFFLIVYILIGTETEGKNEIFKLIYTLGYFITNDFVLLVLGTLLIIPLPLLIFSIFKKRKDLIKGFSISLFISTVLIIAIAIS